MKLMDFATKQRGKPMADYIERQAAIELCDWYQHEFCECDYAFGELANELHKLPSADVQPVRHGKWVKKWHTGFHMELSCCSVCGHYAAILWDYCPACGARMGGEQNETD